LGEDQFRHDAQAAATSTRSRQRFVNRKHAHIDATIYASDLAIIVERKLDR